ncbi:Hydrolase 4 domain-containing protein [Citrus sinensis]|uniref:Hydrolase 4 domain-containing protein n=1 Tax=Citrus sinensis TaxID=2711 RepID=A0ACB8M405_CITSI|nr:Hydrolase 4 domain-containing protein [Citrus sinensis]
MNRDNVLWNNFFRDSTIFGHGGSDGLHAYVHSLDAAVKDMKLFVEKVLADNPGLPCFCFGHSTGAAIVLKAVLDPKFEANVAGVVLTSPAVGVEPSHPIFVVLAPIVSFLLPRYQISAANKNGMPVSRDPEALVAKYTDPLVYTGSIRVRTGYEILRITTYLQRNLNRLKVPFLLLHGTADTVTDPEASKKLHKYASSADKTMKLYQGFLHDLLFEPERDDIVKDIIDWLCCRVHGQVVQ